MVGWVGLTENNFKCKVRFILYNTIQDICITLYTFKVYNTIQLLYNTILYNTISILYNTIQARIAYLSGL